MNNIMDWISIYDDNIMDWIPIYDEKVIDGYECSECGHFSRTKYARCPSCKRMSDEKCEDLYIRENDE